jgi:hypothetical protein
VLGLSVVLLDRLSAPPGPRSHHGHRGRRARRAAGPSAVKPAPDYARDVRPILAARCCRCHGAARHKAGLRLDTAAGIRKGSDGGAVIVPGDASNSLLIAVISPGEDGPRMPPSGEPLDAGQVALLREWINAGAPAPADVEPRPGTAEHWAFRPPARPPVPAAGAGWARNPVDAFLAAGHEAKGLEPNPPAPRALLLRRAFVDLVGLPPTRDELRAFLADPSEDAYEKVVDRLLASPPYGERWGRHWMDVWRYSEADGRKAKNDVWWSNVYLWHWRDWMVRSLNADKGYDRMVVEMLAGDEAAPGDPETLAATGFLVRNWFKLDRNVWLSNTVEHTGKAFLGLTLGCCRCHDHKFDPISQKEYYQFRAFFEPHDIRTEKLPAADGGPCATVAHACDAFPDMPTYVFARGDPKSPDKTAPVAPGVPAALGGPAIRVRRVRSAAGNGQTSTGRRLALARWLVDRSNPLAARVAVNHVWARHFGRPLVENVADFGVRTPAPPQQALLDYLAVEFMDHGWSLKWLHRLLVTSAAYRMQSSVREASAADLAADPENRFYWRMNPRRMEAEVVRDALLCLAGDLDLTSGGPPLDCLAGPDSPRRSLYHRFSREDRMEFLTTFDAAGTEECYRRQESVVPQQALALVNSAFVRDRARRIARRLDGGASLPPREFVTAAFEHVLGRAPAPAELEEGERFLTHQGRLRSDSSRLTPFPLPPPPAPPDPEVLRKVPGLPLVLGKFRPLPKAAPADDPRGQAREDLVHALINHNDFVTVR